ncbi:MAG: acyltransferase [Planctomycetota bacterium]
MLACATFVAIEAHVLKANTEYLPHVDGLRAVAVLVVLLFHLGVPGFGGGFVGVDVFLVISGFLITRLIADEIRVEGRFRFGRFYLRRVRRLAPALLVTVAATALASVLLHSPGRLVRTGEEMVAAILSVSNLYFWVEADYFGVSAESRALLHTWSLSVEEQFYLLWPATLLVLWRLGVRGGLRNAVLGIGVASLLLNLLCGEGIPGAEALGLPEAASDGKPTLFYLTPFRGFEFAVGGVLALLARPPR